MSFNFKIIKHNLQFIKAGGTSRGILTEKYTDFLVIKNINSGKVGIGEISRIPNLSIDDVQNFDDAIINALTAYIEEGKEISNQLPALKFALEMALMHLEHGIENLYGGKKTPTFFKNGIPINGLIWMGSIDDMKNQVKEKLTDGFDCIKLKIGALKFEDEIALIKDLRKSFSKSDLTIRVDANGAFNPKNALLKLEELYSLGVHSIEQPIKAGLHQEMSELCRKSSLPIALDEELIGQLPNKGMLSDIKPQFIILKPSLIGGLKIADDWIEHARALNIGWWATSALESNIGLNAIFQWVGQKSPQTYQGLGTGKLFTNNITSPLKIENAKLKYSFSENWNFPKSFVF